MMPTSMPSSLLIINLGGIGDLLLSTGAVAAVRAALPRARMDLLTIDRGGAFMRTYGLFNTVYTIADTRTPGGALRTLMALRQNRYDLAVNMRTITGWMGGVKLRVLLTLVGARSTAGRNTNGHGSFLDERIPETLLTGQHEYLFDADTIRALGMPVEDPAPLPVPVSADERTAARALLADAGIMPVTPVIGIHPGGEPSHRWPAEYFIGLIRRLRAERPCAFILTGSLGERQLCAHIAAATGAINLAGSTATIGTLAALLEHCGLCIANDTGTMHVCVSVGTPGVFLFGPGHAARYRPFREPAKHSVIQGKAPCAPCESTICRARSCMHAISVDEVYAAAIAHLGRSEPSC